MATSMSPPRLPELVKQLKCACGKKTITPEEVQKKVSPAGLHYTDTTCKECEADKELSDLCTVVCAVCKEPVIKVQPLRNNRTGFEMVKGRVYHSVNCPKCDPEYYESGKPMITVEETIYDAKQKRGKAK